MKETLLNQHGGLRTFAIVLDTGDEAMASLASFAETHQLQASHFTAIGAFSRVVVGYFDWQQKDYRKTAIDDQVEVLSLLGDVTMEERKRNVHAHIVVSRADATAYGGHLIEGHVRPTLEIVLTETPAHLRRRFDARSGLTLIAAE